VYVNGALAQMRVDRDTLTRTMLPWGSAEAFEPFVGLAFGLRYQGIAPVGSKLDEVRVFSRELRPIEVASLNRDSIVSHMDSATLRQNVVDLLVHNQPDVTRSLAALTDAREAHNQIVSIVPQVLVMGDAPEEAATYVLDRGLYNTPRHQVRPRGLESVMKWDASLPGTRLGLAKWLFDPKNPLTARVFVNRIWQMHFGGGIVHTSEDLGSQGSIPTHPELLDWLAIQFVESGWDVKMLHRKIVLSSTYRQVSVPTEELSAIDPDNSLYARGPRWRMTAEMVRDQALGVSKLLVSKTGGPSAMPYQPAGVWNSSNSFYGYPSPDSLPTDEQHRRTMYTFVKRNALHPFLQIFDFRNRTESIARRGTSNTPLQALDLMNDPQFLEAYRSLAAVVLSSSEDGRRAQLRLLYRLAIRATPSEAQIDTLERYFQGEYEMFALDSKKAGLQLGVGVTKADPRLDPIELAALANVASVVMNSPDAYIVR
jgi:hypothetical protein